VGRLGRRKRIRTHHRPKDPIHRQPRKRLPGHEHLMWMYLKD
jgi:hypothetical protein